MKILLFSIEYPPISGGGSTYANSLVSSLSTFYPETEIIIMTSGDNDTVERINDHISIYRFKSCKVAYESTALSAQLINDFKATVSACRPDVIHAFHTIPIIITHMTRERMQIPYVFTQHRTPEPDWMPIKFDGKGELAEMAYELGIKDRWVAPSLFFKNHLEKHGVSSQHITTAFPSVDQSMFSCTDFRKANKKLHELFSINPNHMIITIPVVDRPRKDIRFCLNAINALEEKTNIVVMITGINEGSESLNSFRKSYPEIQFVSHGRLDFNIIPIIMSGSHLVVMCSTYEGFGISCIEALATGTRVAIRTSPGQNEIINSIDTTYPFSTIEGLSEIIDNESKYLSKNNSKQQSIQTLTTFSQQKQADKHMRVYGDLLKKDPIPTMTALQGEFNVVFGHDQSKLKNIDSVFVSGSVAKNAYIRNWSDIDIVVLCKEPTLNKNELECIQQLQINITNKYNCKVGVDYISTQYLKEQEKSDLIGQYEVPNLILFHEENMEHTKKGVLYVDANFTFPVLKSGQFQYLTLDEYKEMCRGLVYEALFRSDGTLPSSVRVLRIITKTCVYLLRMRTLIQDGEYIQDYDKLIEEHLDKYNTEVLVDIYSLARNQSLNNSTVADELIERSLACFNSLITRL